jgi:hypothetical protein
MLSIFLFIIILPNAFCLTCVVKEVSILGNYEIVTNFGGKTCETDAYCIVYKQEDFTCKFPLFNFNKMFLFLSQLAPEICSAIALITLAIQYLMMTYAVRIQRLNTMKQYVKNLISTTG